jgi:hypothetical protein
MKRDVVKKKEQRELSRASQLMSVNQPLIIPDLYSLHYVYMDNSRTFEVIVEASCGLIGAGETRAVFMVATVAHLKSEHEEGRCKKKG